MYIYCLLLIHACLINDFILSQNIGEFQQPFNQNPYYVEQREREREQYEQQQQQQFLNNLNKQNMFYQYYFNRPTYNVIRAITNTLLFHYFNLVIIRLKSTLFMAV